MLELLKKFLHTNKCINILKTPRKHQFSISIPTKLNLKDFHCSINSKVSPSKGTCENVLRHQGTYSNLKRNKSDPVNNLYWIPKLLMGSRLLGIKNIDIDLAKRSLNTQG